jgi:hypothetical protein
MGRAKIVMMALAAGGVVMLVGPSPAAAYDYPWCIQGGGWGIPGDCSYQTDEQCLASASGRRVWCNINPRVAFERQRHGRPPYPNYRY